MRRLSDWLGAAYVASGLAGLVCIAAVGVALVVPGLEAVGFVAVRGLILAAFLVASFKLAAIAAFRAEGRHG